MIIDTILQSIVVTFISLLALICGIAIFVGYLINKASDLGGPGFLSNQLEGQKADLGTFAAESSTEVGAEGGVRNPGTIWNFPGSSANSPETAVDGPGALPRASLTRSPCRFCRRVREGVVNAWNRL